MKAILFLPALCFIYACDPAPANFESGAPAIRVVADAYEETAEPAAAKKAVSAAKQSLEIERKLIRTGRLTLEVDDVGVMRGEIEKICHEFDAYISSETQSHYHQRLECTQVARIPSQHFDAFTKKVESLGVEVKDRNIETSDVTEEFIDMEARIKTKKELEGRYREILRQAKEVSDMLSIEAQLNHVRSDIEAMEGRIKYLRNQVAYSTLTLSYYEPNGTEPAFASQTLAALGNGWDMLLAFVVSLLNIWPFILLATACIYAAIRKSRSRRIKASPDVVS